ncbi:MFS transporter [Bacillus sp. AFS076308]|uniref:MFS transporter n=1 Tax=unclassified Bacillus (in: firmicutes) TaxID=185979 RepID=UPI000BF6C4E5|nr:MULTISPECIES: MFS transporter [unclassified Bacillus (in: firmicutes)]PFN97252.1 MFS transporter [Bacillus sp. AFS076308]PGV51682.1 MFS transporter [Bacillus sp. AFS037270]
MSLAKEEVFKSNIQTEKIHFKEKVGYASGDLACNLIYQTVSTYLLFFYTDVFGISAAAAGTMFLIVRGIDALSDPFIGTIVDKTNTKYGKFRPFLLFGAIPFALLAILCFTTPQFGGWGKLVYAYITYIGLSITYTCINVPYSALTSAITRDSKEVVDLTSTRMFFANLGGLIVSFGVPLLASFIGDSTSTKTGWQMTMTIMGIAGALLLLYCFRNTNERVKIKEVHGKIKFADIFEQFRVNRPLVVLCVFFILIFGINSISNSVGIYYVTYNVGRPDLVSWYGMLGSLPALLLMPFLPVLNKKLGKKNLMRVSLSLTIVGTLALLVIPTTAIPLILAARLIAAAGSLIAGGFMWALIPETIEYGDYKTGKRLGGLINAMIGFFFKFGMALGGIVPGLVLQQFGYVADQAQTPHALTGILITTAVIPAVLLAVALMVINLYELDEKKYAEVVKALEMRDRIGSFKR